MPRAVDHIVKTDANAPKCADRPQRRVVFVLDASLDDMPMDCCDDDRVHMWLYCMEWSGRRAFLTQGSTLLKVNGGEPMNPTKQDVNALRGEAFYAVFEFPTFEPDSGERIDLQQIEKCPPIAEVMERLQARMQE